MPEVNLRAFYIKMQSALLIIQKQKSKKNIRRVFEALAMTLRF